MKRILSIPTFFALIQLVGCNQVSNPTSFTQSSKSNKTQKTEDLMINPKTNSKELKTNKTSKTNSDQSSIINKVMENQDPNTQENTLNKINKDGKTSSLNNQLNNLNLKPTVKIQLTEEEQKSQGNNTTNHQTSTQTITTSLNNPPVSNLVQPNNSTNDTQETEEETSDTNVQGIPFSAIIGQLVNQLSQQPGIQLNTQNGFMVVLQPCPVHGVFHSHGIEEFFQSLTENNSDEEEN